MSEREAVRQADAMSVLGRTPGFQMLSTKITEKRRRMRLSLASRVMDGQSMELTQRQVDYDRGFIDGMNYPLQVVQNAQKLTELEQELASPEPDEEEDHWYGYGQG